MLNCTFKIYIGSAGQPLFAHFCQDGRDKTQAGSREARSEHVLGLSLGNLGITFLFNGKVDLAHKNFFEVVKLARDKENPILKTACIYWIAIWVFEQRNFRKFIQLNSAIADTQYFISVIYFVPPLVQTTFQRDLHTARQMLSKEDLNAAEVEGKAMILEQALRLAEQSLI